MPPAAAAAAAAAASATPWRGRGARGRQLALAAHRDLSGGSKPPASES